MIEWISILVRMTIYMFIRKMTTGFSQPRPAF